MRATVLALFLVLLCPLQILAAKGQAEVKLAGEHITTPYFSITIPEGWLMADAVKKQPLDGISAVFANTSGTMALAISIMRAHMSARELAMQTGENMRKTGLKTTAPREIDGFWKIDIEGPANGVGWFGSNGKFCSVITLFGSDFSGVSQFIKAISTEYPQLFPKSLP